MEYFALAEGVSEGRYLDLKFNQYIGVIDRNCLLVKVAIAEAQIEQEAKERTKAEIQVGAIPVTTYGSSTVPVQPDGKETAP